MRPARGSAPVAVRAILVAGFGTIALVACSRPDRSDTPRPTTSPPTTRTATGEAVQLQYEPGVADIPATTATLRCDADPEATGYLAGRPVGPACEALVVALVERPPGQPCSSIYGGPQRLIITVPPPTPSGPVRLVEIERTDGCEIARFDAARALLPPGAGREDWTGADPPSAPTPTG